MVVYSHFGGVPELTGAVIDHGFRALDTAFGEVVVTEDPVADLATLALTCRRVARQSPHLYDLMFGLSTRATYRPLTPYGAVPRGTSSAFRDAYARIFAACARLVDSGRIATTRPMRWPLRCGVSCTGSSRSNSPTPSLTVLIRSGTS